MNGQERAGEGKGRRGLAKGKAGEGWRRERQERAGEGKGSTVFAGWLRESLLTLLQ